MATKRVYAGSRSLVTLFDSGTLGSQSDRDLLECFQTDSGPVGQEAFRMLVERHGPMVLGLCRTVVRDQHEAEDAFQATFLVLVRKAGSIQRRDTLGPWIYGVAAKVARRARRRLKLRLKREIPIASDIPGRHRALHSESSTEQLVHDEIARLPQSIQKPLILCCLQGLSYELAAQQLRVNPSTVRGRLERARKRLSARLRERGAVSSVGVPALDSVRAGFAPLPSILIESTVQFSLRWPRLTGLLGGGVVVPDTVSALAQGVVQSMLYQTIRVSAVAVLAAGAIGAAVLAQQGKGRVTDGTAPAPIAAENAQNQGAKTLQTEAQDRHKVEAPREKKGSNRAEGSVTFVDDQAKVVLVSLSRSMGVRAPMVMTVIDARSLGFPREKAKASIEITSAGENFSHARIIKTNDPADPIRAGDIVFSPFWSPERPTRFALLGMMELDGDSNDDRSELNRMIKDSGGIVAFDLPPLGLGKETGELSPRIDWYVKDDRVSLPRDPQAKMGKRMRGIIKLDFRLGEATLEAHRHGIRPMTIERLLAYLGHDLNSPLPGAKDDRVNSEQTPKKAAGTLQAMDEAQERSRLETAAAQRTEVKNAQIRRKLDMRIDAEFPKGANLEILLKHIKQVTTDATYPGIPIYVDPIGLAEANKTMGTAVELNYKQQPIGSVLYYSLRPLGLSFCIRDGFVRITSRTGVLENRVEEIDRKLDNMLELLGRLPPAK
jgi:RNA polymerase sigma factor (sigma-70 family)